jgi:hypothetical protein
MEDRSKDTTDARRFVFLCSTKRTLVLLMLLSVLSTGSLCARFSYGEDWLRSIASASMLSWVEATGSDDLATVPVSRELEVLTSYGADDVAMHSLHAPELTTNGAWGGLAETLRHGIHNDTTRSISTAAKTVQFQGGELNISSATAIENPSALTKIRYPIFVASTFKSGTTSVSKYFRCGGVKSSHTAHRRCAMMNVDVSDH